MTGSSDYSKSALVQRLALAYKDDQDATQKAKDAATKFEIAKTEAQRSQALAQGEARTCSLNNSRELITVHRVHGGNFMFTVSLPNETS